MSFRVAQKTLESLEWPEVVAMLVRHCRTPQARLRLGASALTGGPSRAAEWHAAEAEPRSAWESQAEAEADSSTQAPLALDELEPTLAGVRKRQAETGEARALLEAGESPPFAGIADLRRALRRAEMEAVLETGQLLDVRSSLEALGSLARYTAKREVEAPHLAELGLTLETHPEVEDEIGCCLDPSGEVRDTASPALAEARRDVHRLSGQLQERLARYLKDEDVRSGLSDGYFTVRNDRYVLPVRSDSRGKVRGIVHDASRSGTTLFIEPEAVIDLNNRLKQAELTQTREVTRILRELSRRVAAILPDLRSGLATLASLDLAFARAQLAIEMEAVEARVERDGVFVLPQLRHPLLPREESVANDLLLGERYSVLVISGPNGGGKTIAMKAVGLAALMVRLGLQVPAGPGARVNLVDEILVDIGDGQDLHESLSTFSAHMVNLAQIVSRASPHTLALLDEIGVGTDPSEGAALAQAVLEELADAGTRVITTTHYNLLKEMADVDERFHNASVEFDPETLAPTYRLHSGAPGSSSATAVAARMGMPASVLERANGLLRREDRQLDRMLVELANSRAALEREQQEAARVRAEGETVRDEYRGKLERLQERRDKLFHAMRSDLDETFRNAHAQVAAVIRDLQRTGQQEDTRGAARGAAHARERLLRLDESTRAAAEERDLGAAPPQEEVRAIDWRHARPGDLVRVPGGATGSLEALPDRRGRVRIKVGSNKLELPADRVRAATAPHGRGVEEAARRPHSGPTGPESALVAGGTLECDLRGQRVDEAIDRLIEALDQALHRGHEALLVIHGSGTGALRSAVREFFTASPHVIQHRPGERGEGGNGVTFAELRG